MSAYLTPGEYAALTGREAGDGTAALLDRASAQVDVLTFQRIRAVGFEALTEMQQDLVKAATARQAAFLTDYGDMADTPLASYGIGDVSMAWDGAKVVQQSGVTAPAEVLALLRQTDLCCRELR